MPDNKIVIVKDKIPGNQPSWLYVLNIRGIMGSRFIKGPPDNHHLLIVLVKFRLVECVI